MLDELANNALVYTRSACFEQFCLRNISGMSFGHAVFLRASLPFKAGESQTSGGRDNGSAAVESASLNHALKAVR